MVWYGNALASEKPWNPPEKWAGTFCSLSCARTKTIAKLINTQEIIPFSKGYDDDISGICMPRWKSSQVLNARTTSGGSRKIARKPK
jgi:hypothetical protein